MAKKVGILPTVNKCVLAVPIAVLMAFMSTGVGLADTSLWLGNATSGNAPCQSGGGADAIPTSTVSDSYALPGAGTITSWSVQAPSAAFFNEITVGFELWRPTLLVDGSYQYVLVAVDVPTAPIPTDGQIHTYTVAIDGQKDDVIGLWESGWSTCGHYTGIAGDVYQTFDDATPASGTTILQTPGSPMNGWELDLGASFVAAPISEPRPIPTSIDQCFNHQWGALVDDAGNKFKNQGDCVSFVATNGNNPAG